MKENQRKNGDKRSVLLFAIFASMFLFSVFAVYAAPVNPDEWQSDSNLTKAAASNLSINISGGVIAKFNVSATVQNPRWKAFVGDVVGKFTLDSSTGDTIYDWTLSAVSGRVYASRHYADVDWSTIGCADNLEVESENSAMAHSGASDNITATFKDDSLSHDAFYVGGTLISSCEYALNTYVNSNPQDSTYDEVVLSDAEGELVYANIITDNAIGFDGSTYDFQMLVPENGTEGYSSSTPYYLYVEISS